MKVQHSIIMMLTNISMFKFSPASPRQNPTWHQLWHSKALPDSYQCWYSWIHFCFQTSAQAVKTE